MVSEVNEAAFFAKMPRHGWLPATLKTAIHRDLSGRPETPEILAELGKHFATIRDPQKTKPVIATAVKMLKTHDTRTALAHLLSEAAKLAIATEKSTLRQTVVVAETPWANKEQLVHGPWAQSQVKPMKKFNLAQLFKTHYTRGYFHLAHVDETVKVPRKILGISLPDKIKTRTVLKKTPRKLHPLLHMLFNAGIPPRHKAHLFQVSNNVYSPWIRARLYGDELKRMQSSDLTPIIIQRLVKIQDKPGADTRSVMTFIPRIQLDGGVIIDVHLQDSSYLDQANKIARALARLTKTGVMIIPNFIQQP